MTEGTYRSESGTYGRMAIIHCLGCFSTVKFPARAWHVIVVIRLSVMVKFCSDEGSRKPLQKTHLDTTFLNCALVGRIEEIDDNAVFHYN